jgi:hypothetical protein
VVAENTRFVKMEIMNEIKEELNKIVQLAIQPINEKLDNELPTLKSLAISGLVLAGVALLGVIWFGVR